MGACKKQPYKVRREQEDDNDFKPYHSKKDKPWHKNQRKEKMCVTCDAGNQPYYETMS